MLRLFNRNTEPSDAKVLDKAFEIITLRESLRLIHDNKQQRAIDHMEVALDAAVITLALHLDKCKTSTRELIETELKKLCLYRSQSPARSANWLEAQDQTTLDGLLSMKARAEEI